MIVKVPMSTYKGKSLESYSKEQLISIVETVWKMYADTAQENYMILSRGQPRSRRFFQSIASWLDGH